ncbi:hypothetical protein ABGI61_08850 [Rheinheimera sp. FR7-31]|uniref:hypothetical protein n=1 Tax=Rheinheimera fenheensis TaxID=3152295 RepID=UPI00325C3A4A
MQQISSTKAGKTRPDELSSSAPDNKKQICPYWPMALVPQDISKSRAAVGETVLAIDALTEGLVIACPGRPRAATAQDAE